MNNGSLDNNNYNHHKGLVNAPQSTLQTEIGKDTNKELEAKTKALAETRSEETK